MRDVVYMMKYLGCTENDEREGTYIGEMARSIGEKANEQLVRCEQNEND